MRDILLGNDSLTAHACVLNFKTMHASFGGQVKLPLEVEWLEEMANTASVHLNLTNKLILEPFTQRQVRVKSDELNNMCGTVLVNSLESAACRGLLCAKGYPEVWGG